LVDLITDDESDSDSEDIINRLARTKKLNPVHIKRSKRMRYSDTRYDIGDIIAEKRNRKENIVVSPIKPFPAPGSTFAHSSGQSKNVNKINNECAAIAETVANVDPILLQILSWKFENIVQDVIQNKEDLTITCDKPLLSVKMSYSSLQEYIDIYEPLMLHETWSQLIDAFQNSQRPLLNMTVSSFEMLGSYLKVSCEVPLNMQDSQFNLYANIEGELLIVDLPISKDKKPLTIFGYVYRSCMEEISQTTLISKLNSLPADCTHIAYVHIKIKSVSAKLCLDKPIKARPVFYIKPMLRNMEALFLLNNSPLCANILKPDPMTCQVIFEDSKPLKIDTKVYNKSQFKAITASIEVIKKPLVTPKILMIQGPPGTGKTFTLIGMIKGMFLNWDTKQSPLKILICAPSNGAIDEIARRLHNERHFLTKCSNFKRSLRMVRIGQLNQMHADVKKMALDELVDANMTNLTDENTKINQVMINDLKNKISEKDDLIMQSQANGDKSKANGYSQEVNQLLKKLHTLKKECGDKANVIKLKKRTLRSELLKKADVILSTLNSCRLSLLEQIFNVTNNSVNFNCVIVDEASQCCEPEILMPLTYSSISKMILIGDPMQLPATVISKKAAGYNYGRSLFERMFSYFGKYSSMSPVLMLDTQYRMHSEISSFPSQHFYDSKLLTSAKLNSRRFSLCPYIVFNLEDTFHDLSNRKNVFNELEANFVINVVSNVAKLIKPNKTVGIITPYQGQKKLLLSKLEQLNLPIKPDINTIDGFQGQERDVILLSCVRDFGQSENSSIGFLNSSQRLNVALTRAKHSLIICASNLTSINSKLWQSLLKDAESRNKMVRLSCHHNNDLSQHLRNTHKV